MSNVATVVDNPAIGHSLLAHHRARPHTFMPNNRSITLQIWQIQSLTTELGNVSGVGPRALALAPTFARTELGNVSRVAPKGVGTGPTYNAELMQLWWFSMVLGELHC